MIAIKIPTRGKMETINIPDKDLLGALQDIVGGYIEPCAPIQFKERGIELLANEEGIIHQLPLNENILPFFFVGDLVAVGIGDEDFVSLNETQINFVYRWLEALKR